MYSRSSLILTISCSPKNLLTPRALWYTHRLSSGSKRWVECIGHVPNKWDSELKFYIRILTHLTRLWEWQATASTATLDSLLYRGLSESSRTASIYSGQPSAAFRRQVLTNHNDESLKRRVMNDECLCGSFGRTWLTRSSPTNGRRTRLTFEIPCMVTYPLPADNCNSVNYLVSTGRLRDYSLLRHALDQTRQLDDGSLGHRTSGQWSRGRGHLWEPESCNDIH